MSTTIPESIDATGETDVTGQLRAFFASLPDCATVEFPAAGRYLVESEVKE